jgi:hypothetical protein
MRTIAAALLLVGAAILPSEGYAEIHRCKDADGNMVFSQFPCAEEPAAEQKEQEPEAKAAEGEASDSQVPDADVDVATHVRDSQMVTQCKKPYRDAIDAIEARMLNGYTPDEGEAYKKQLLGLTRGLRNCES